MIYVEVEGRPAPKGSRIARTNKQGRVWTYPASRHERPWVDAVAEAARLVMRHREIEPPPYVIRLEFLIQMPALKNRSRMRAWPAQKDLDKLARAVVDGLVRGKAMEDDRHLIELHVSKRWATDVEAPGVRCTIGHTDEYALSEVRSLFA